MEQAYDALENSILTIKLESFSKNDRVVVEQSPANFGTLFLKNSPI